MLPKSTNEEIIWGHLNLLQEGNWASRLRAIEKLKNLKERDEVLTLHQLVLESKYHSYFQELIQIYEYYIRYCEEVKVWEATFYALFDLLESEEGKNQKILDTMIEGLLKLKLDLKQGLQGRNHQRPQLVYALDRTWALSRPSSRFLLIKKIIKFNIKELFGLINKSLDYGPVDISTKLARSLVQVGETRILPLLRRWANKGDDLQRKEAIIGLGKIGGFIEVPFLLMLLKREKGNFKKEVCLSLIKILPFGRTLILKTYWDRAKDLEVKASLLKDLSTLRKTFALVFLKKVFLSSFPNELEQPLIFSLSGFSHPKKVSFLIRGYDQLIEEKQMQMLLILKGRPYPELEDFYLRIVGKEEVNPFLKIIILESLGHFKTPRIANALFQYLIGHNDMSVGYAYSALVKNYPEIASEFILNEYLKRDTQGEILAQSILKSIPRVSPFLRLNNNLRNLFLERFDKGSLSEKAFILRGLPYLLDDYLVKSLVERYYDQSDKVIQNLKSVSLIKSAFLYPPLLERIVPLMDEPQLVNAFRKEKIKTAFIENLGMCILEFEIENTLFVTTFLEDILKVFVETIDQYEIPAVVIKYFELLSIHPKLVTKISIAKAKKAYFGKGLEPLDEAFVEFALLSGKLEDLQNYLDYREHNSPDFVPLSHEMKNLSYTLGGSR
jgi:hypothetical protein